jgi:SPOR domain
LQEFELSGMRDRFLAVSDEIANELAALIRRIGEVPPSLRGPLIVAAGQIAEAQERLRIEADRLVGLPTHRAAIMQKVLQVQEGAFRHLKVILQQHVAFIPNQVTDLAHRLAEVNRYEPTGPNASNMGNGNPLAPYPVQVNGLIAASSGGIDRYSWIDGTSRSEEQIIDKAMDEDLSRGNRGRIFGHNLTLKRLTSIVGTAASRSLMLVFIAAVGLSLAYANFPRASDQRGVATVPERRVRAVAPVTEQRANWKQSAQPTQTQATQSTADLDAESRSKAIPSGAIATSESWLPPPQTPAMQAAPSSAPIGAPANDSVTVRSPGAPVDTSIAALPTPSAAPPTAPEQFVPVVFTHQDKQTAQRAFNELRQQYPKLLQHRQSELQPVDVGNKGVWYRLLVLPPGSRQQATETCSRLAAAGYDRCWVKIY